jgi:multiple sugar transport system substrate-binding protein
VPSAVTGAECAADATEVKFWTSHTPPASDSLANIVNAFNQANPDICVKMTIVPGAETDVTKLLTSIRGGVAPDVYMADRFTVPERAANGVLAELPAEAAGMSGDFLEFAWAETQYQGKTYALPFDTDARALFYNKDMIEAAGQDASKLDIKNGAATIADVVAIADAITEKDDSGNYTTMGFVPWPDQGWHYTWGFAYGGSFADLDACKVTPTDDGVVAAYQFLYDWAKDHDPEKVQRWVTTNYPPQLPTQQNPFINGKVAMVITGDWRIAEMAQYAPDTNYAFTLIPVPNEGDESATWAGGWSAALIPGSQHPDEAVKFMEYFTGEEGQRVYTKETGHLPTLKSLLDDDSLYDEQHLVFRQLLDVAHNRPPLAVGALYWDNLTTAMDAVTLNTKEPMPALQEVQDTVQPELDQVGC